MISLQILNKVLSTANATILERYALTEEYFPGYEKEYNFIKQHLETYQNVPDKATMVSKFHDFELLEVNESDEYLVSTIKEQHLYYKACAVVQTVADKLRDNSDEAVQYLLSQLDTLKPSQIITGVDIIGSAADRYEVYANKQKSETPFYIPTGFKELDDLLGGWAKGEEFVVLFARTGMGKSWLLIASMANAFAHNYKVGYISPEMSADKIGYRFDTVFKNFSNKSLVRGNNVEGYKEYIDNLSSFPNSFLVATPKDFQKNITVSKLKSFCINNKLDILAIDGITYLRDERRQRGDNKTTMLTNISEDLMALSCELQIPILTVVQSNRGGVKQEGESGTPELENIKDSDGIAHNATKVIAIKQDAGCLEVSIKKHRDGETGGSVHYKWDIDTGKFSYMPSAMDYSTPQTKTPQQPVKRSESDYTDIF